MSPGDHTAWPRPQAPTLKDRTHEHHPQGNLEGWPICVGQGYSSIICVPETEGSWALPLLDERITSFESPLQKAATQLRQVCQAVEPRPLSLWDSEYGCASFVNLTKDRQTGSDADEQQTLQDDKLGVLRLRRWSGLHFRQSAAPPMTLILVERLDEKGQLKQKPLWLVWVGQQLPALETLWQLYLARFCIEHWYRFIKQRFHWCLPHLQTSEQAEAWSHLMPLMTWQLWLARPEAPDPPLPWQKPWAKQTPGRVTNAFAAILARIGSPAHFPKP